MSAAGIGSHCIGQYRSTRSRPRRLMSRTTPPRPNARNISFVSAWVDRGSSIPGSSSALRELPRKSDYWRSRHRRKPGTLKTKTKKGNARLQRLRIFCAYHVLHSSFAILTYLSLATWRLKEALKIAAHVAPSLCRFASSSFTSCIST